MINKLKYLIFQACRLFNELQRILLGHASPLPLPDPSVRNDKRYMPIYNDTKLMFIQDISNLSSGFMPSQGAFLWSDKLCLMLTGKTQVHLRLNASTFYLKRPCVLLQTQGRLDQDAKAFSEVL